MGITHFDEARSREFVIGHLGGRWSMLGESAGSVGAGVRRIQVPAGLWSTPVHEHGREEEIFYVLAGRGISWHGGQTAAIRAGDAIVYLANGGAHSIHALEDIDLLAFGPRAHDESVGFPRLGLSLVGNRAVESVPYAVDGAPIQFVRESQLGAPDLPAEPGERPTTIVNLADVEPATMQRPRIARTRRDLGRAVGSVAAGLQHVEVVPGMLATPQHCHSAEEEIFVILDGDGVLLLGSDEIPVRAGHVIARPPGTAVAHALRAGDAGLTFLAYGTREPNDIVYYPRSNNVILRGVGVVARLEHVELWDGEDEV
jgi:uncharacterized cupin superfamily protein